ncbi:transposase [Microcoleus sp. B3-D7]|uniref:transposase n=1 Tax=Microcoleus sp. B3-D7 TaxID=2818659 RepID=UPI002FD536BA
MACISEVQANGKITNALLFSTDVHLPPEQIVEYYQARFQIEFIFRDAKEFTGLSDCQARHLPQLDFHFNASLLSLNLAKHPLYSCHSSAKSFVFSICSYKRCEFNKHLLSTFIDK